MLVSSVAGVSVVSSAEAPFLFRKQGGIRYPGYRIISQMPGYNGVAVERQEVHKGVVKNHLAVFEFRENKVTKIIEYWK